MDQVMTPEQEKQLALDIFQKRVFLDRFIPSSDQDMLRSVFMVLMFMDGDQVKVLMEKLGDKGAIYEYYDRAGPLAVNGYPTFISMKILTSEQAQRVFSLHKQMTDAIEAIGVQGENHDKPVPTDSPETDNLRSHAVV